MTILPIFDEEAMAEIDSNAYFTALEALERAENAARSQKISRADIARRIGMDKGTVTKILNGTHRNITLKTLFALMAAMNRKAFIESIDVNALKFNKPNFAIEPATTTVPSSTYVGSEKSKNNTNTYLTA